MGDAAGCLPARDSHRGFGRLAIRPAAGGHPGAVHRQPAAGAFDPGAWEQRRGPAGRIRSHRHRGGSGAAGAFRTVDAAASRRGRRADPRTAGTPSQTPPGPDLASTAGLHSGPLGRRPAAYYVASGSLDTRALGVWLLASLYSGSSVFYVRLHYRPPARRKGEPVQEGRLAAERQMGTYLATVFATTAVLGLAGALPPLAMAAFVPLAIKVAWAWRRRDLRPSLRQIGLREMGHSALFLLLAGGAMRAWG